MLNRVSVHGRMVADPDVKKIGENTVANFRIAVDRQFKNKETGEREADFFNCVAWRGTADGIAQYIGKGDEIVMDGRLQSRTYQDKEGNNRSVVEILVDSWDFCGSKKSSDEEAPGAKAKPAIRKKPDEYAETADGDELPF